jgi:hypothetical protein
MCDALIFVSGIVDVRAVGSVAGGLGGGGGLVWPPRAAESEGEKSEHQHGRFK